MINKFKWYHVFYVVNLTLKYAHNRLQWETRLFEYLDPSRTYKVPKPLTLFLSYLKLDTRRLVLHNLWVEREGIASGFTRKKINNHNQ
jgi:hypothetical protein